MQKQLDHLCLIKISGDDANTFLQGQLSNDINELEHNWHYSAYCSPKGRILALLHVWRAEGAIYALLDVSLLEATLSRLKMYVMRSKVTIKQISNTRFWGLKSISTLQTIDPEMAARLLEPGVSMAESENDKGQLFALTISNRIMLIDLTKTPRDLFGDGYLCTQQWLAQDIDDGLAHVNSSSSELFIPQMLNLDVLGGISFKKGCYTGQEIVARMHYLGKLKQRMFVCELSSKDSSCTPGAKIFSDTDLSKVVGNLVLSTDHHTNVLAVLRLDHITSDSANKPTLFLDSQTQLTPVTPQPYSLPSQAKN